MNYENQILDALMIVSAWDLPEEELLPEDSELTGLPLLVQVSMLLTNNTVLETVTKIPGSNLNSLPLRVEGQSFGSSLAEAAARERALLDEGLGGRGGGSARGNRAGRDQPRIEGAIPSAPWSGGGD